jgi:hypothetical protein
MTTLKELNEQLARERDNLRHEAILILDSSVTKAKIRVLQARILESAR